MHFLSGFPVLAVSISPGQIVKYQLNGFDCQGVGIVRGHDGDIGFKGMGKDIRSGVGGDTGRNGQGKFRVDYGYVRREFIICYRVFNILSLSVMTAKEVTSEPVPEVVGIATNLALGLLRGIL